MGRVVILEGPDGGGKTTLARELEKCGFTYVHTGPPENGYDSFGLLRETLDNLNWALNHTNDVVFDRLWLGERIYGPIARGRDLIGDEGQKLIMRIHSSKRILMLLCYPKFAVARTNYEKKIQEKDDYLKSRDRWDKVFLAYHNWAYKYATIGQMYDYTQDTIDDVFGALKYRTLDFPAGMIGSPNANFLFIGDTPNHDTIDVPFFAYSGSSGYLNKAIELTDIKEHQLALANALGPRGEQRESWRFTGTLPYLTDVFLMGDKAQKWYTHMPESGLRVHHIPHPSYLKRFKGHNPQVMADLITEKLNGVSRSSTDNSSSLV